LRVRESRSLLNITEWFYDMHQFAVPGEELFDDVDQITDDGAEIIDNPERNGFANIRYHWSEDPEKDEAWYRTQCRDLNFDSRKINQELDLKFVGSTNCIFDDDFLAKLKPIKSTGHLKMPHATRLNFYTEQFDVGDFLLVGVDSAKSLIGDYNAIEIFSYANFIQVGEYFGKLGSLKKYSEVLMYLTRHLCSIMNDRVILCIENNSIGAAIIENLENADDGFGYMDFVYTPTKSVMKSEKGRIVHKQRIESQSGINTNAQNKGTMVSCLYDNLIQDPELIKSNDLIAQLHLIERKYNGTVSAQSGKHDDLFMASALCAYIKRLSILEIQPLLSSSIFQTQFQQNEKSSILGIKDLKTISSNMVYNEDEGGFEYITDKDSETIHSSDLPIFF